MKMLKFGFLQEGRCHLEYFEDENVVKNYQP